MRLIDADTLMEAMYHRAFETDGDTMWQSGCWVRYKAIEQTIKAQPEIIRCKDCKHWDGVDTCDVIDAPVWDNDFCSMAERRSDE